MLWKGCAPPWVQTVSLCPRSDMCHGSTVHLLLIQCPAWELLFGKVWLSKGGDWT